MKIVNRLSIYRISGLNMGLNITLLQIKEFVCLRLAYSLY